jgi:hypothetical protein
MKVRIALLITAAALGCGCDAVPDFMRETMGTAIKTEIETKTAEVVQGATSSVLDDILGALVPMIPTDGSTIPALAE